MTKLTEYTIEELAIERLKALGYGYVQGSAITQLKKLMCSEVLAR